MNWPSIALAFVGVMGMIITYFSAMWKLRERIAAGEKEVSALRVECERRFIAVETKIDVFWTGIGNSVIDLLKHPTELEKDELLDRLKEDTLDIDDLRKLKYMLQQEVKPFREAKDPRSVAWALILALIEQRIMERLEIKEGKKREQCTSP